ncbi:hypothetical protein WA026_002994 [Henosepilachna vigintioctopunctata]|uniref:Nucleolar protein 6 n=1 Tax=Henosepilachna vigintioctopunctata TaxID=420089 RepID=A0AAW1TM02_9CUCU
MDVDMSDGDTDESIKGDTIDRPSKRHNTSESSVGKKKQKFKQPTVEELNDLHETQTLFNNNLFRLQISELLEATKIKNKYNERLTSWINEFQLFLGILPVHDPINISNFSSKAANRPSRDLRFIKNITSHCKNNLRCDQDISVLFVRPNCMSTFGLFKIGSLPGPHLKINLQLTIPKECFHVKDFLNNRYLVKKFYYLMYIAEHLKSQNICSSIKCSYYQDSILLPHLVVVPSNAEKVFVNIFVVPEQNYFKGHRFLPYVNNVKVPVFEQDLPMGVENNFGEMPTKYYNSALGFDVTLVENIVFIEQTISHLTNVQEGLKLIIVWMNQRKLNEGMGTFHEDIVIYIIVYLVFKKKINNHMSSYQVFRNFLNFMITTNLTKDPISICENITEEVIQQFNSAFDVVIIDRTGYYNVAAFLNASVYFKMRYECQLAFSILDQDTLNSFSNLFLVNIPFHLQYDGIIDIKSDNNFETVLQNVDTNEKAAYLGHHYFLIIKILQSYLKRGLNKRVLNIVPLVPSLQMWDYGVRQKLINHRIIFGIQLDPDSAFDILEYGPNLNDPGDTDFREFWGRLSSNRRFRDGTAKVVVHFDTKTIKEQREIIKNIIDFILTDKLNLNYKFYYNEFEDVLLNKRINAWYPVGTNEETSLKIIRSSDKLGQKIRSLGVQLSISGIGGISDVYCYTNVFPPVPTSYRSGKSITTTRDHNIILKEKKLNAAPKYVEPIECAIYLEHSSKWPTDLDALHHMKILLYLEISKLLFKNYKIVSSVKPSFIDVLYDGTIFRYTLFVSKEVGLLKKSVKANGALIYRDTEKSLELEKKFTILPKIIGALKGMQAQFPCYGISTCLAKRWIRSQLIDDYLFPDMIINLLNAQQFISQSLYTAATTPQVAFLRFLKYIIDVTWDLEPIVINFNNELTREQISNVDTQMRINRDKYPPLFILTPYDNGDSIFTKKAPSKQVLVRLKLLAAECLDVVANIVLNESLYSIKELFIPNINGFNCVLHLRSLINPRRHERILNVETDGKVPFSEPTKEAEENMPVIDFDPVQMYLKELRINYGAFCVFFHDTYGGNFIGVLWNPKELEPRNIKVSYMLGRKVENDKLILDKEEIIRGFHILGKDILKSIDNNT